MYKHVANATEATCGKRSDIVFDAYANGDIVFTKGLVDTLAQVKNGWGREIASGARRGVMIVGKRTNVDYHSQNLTNDDEVVQLSKMGQVFQNDAEDYFLYSRGSRDWDLIPDFVVGRRAYDNWLVHNAHHDEAMDVIDASDTVLGLHLTAADGNKAGHKKGADNDHNKQVLNPVTKKSVHGGEWASGRTDNGHFFTKHHNGTVVVVIRSGQAGKRTLPVALKNRRRLLSAVSEPRLRVPRHATGGKAVPQMTWVDAGEDRDREEQEGGRRGGVTRKRRGKEKGAGEGEKEHEGRGVVDVGAMPSISVVLNPSA